MNRQIQSHLFAVLQLASALIAVALPMAIDALVALQVERVAYGVGATLTVGALHQHDLAAVAAVAPDRERKLPVFANHHAATDAARHWIGDFLSAGSEAVTSLGLIYGVFATGRTSSETLLKKSGGLVFIDSVGECNALRPVALAATIAAKNAAGKECNQECNHFDDLKHDDG